MPLKKDVLQLTSISLLFAAYYLLKKAYLHSTILIASMITHFILMVVKEKSTEGRVSGRVRMKRDN